MGIANLNMLDIYMFSVVEEDTNDNLLCTLADGIFGESIVTMTRKSGKARGASQLFAIFKSSLFQLFLQ